MRVPVAGSTGITFWGGWKLFPTLGASMQQEVGPYNESAGMSFRKSVGSLQLCG